MKNLRSPSKKNFARTRIGSRGALVTEGVTAAGARVSGIGVAPFLRRRRRYRKRQRAGLAIMAAARSRQQIHFLRAYFRRLGGGYEGNWCAFRSARRGGGE